MYKIAFVNRGIHETTSIDCKGGILSAIEEFCSRGYQLHQIESIHRQ